MEHHNHNGEIMNPQPFRSYNNTCEPPPVTSPPPTKKKKRRSKVKKKKAVIALVQALVELLG